MVALEILIHVNHEIVQGSSETTEISEHNFYCSKLVRTSSNFELRRHSSFTMFRISYVHYYPF